MNETISSGIFLRQIDFIIFVHYLCFVEFQHFMEYQLRQQFILSANSLVSYQDFDGQSCQACMSKIFFIFINLSIPAWKQFFDNMLKSQMVPNRPGSQC